MVATANRSTLCRGRTRGGWAPGVVRGPNHRRVVDAETVNCVGSVEWGVVPSSARPSDPLFEHAPSSTTPHSPTSFTMYIELHCHSAYSFLHGASLPEQLALTA